MGDIRDVMSFEKVESPVLYDEHFRIEMGEEGAIHIHWRDVRIVLTEKQLQALKVSFAKVGDISYTGKDTVIDHLFIPEAPLFGKEMKIELLMNGCIHFHYRDMRIEMEEKMFLALCQLWQNAYLEWKAKYEKII